ncbi:MAG: SMC-Scp complex subunit ScpB [Dehalococcoidia bacterium]|nr:SMC-Scp complex subunit ScpB [Dehalococcoidia bacterium]
MTEAPAGLLRLVVESILFVAEDPLELSALARLTDADVEDVARAVDEIAASCRDRGVRVQRTGSAVQMVTAPECAPYVQRFLGIDEDQRLSRTVLAALTVIAYKQPITRTEIERILGKSCEWALASLRARDLVAEVGRAPGPGRPYLYGTTFRFLEHFGLEKPADLPELPELPELAGEAASTAAEEPPEGRA